MESTEQEKLVSLSEQQQPQTSFVTIHALRAISSQNQILVVLCRHFPTFGMCLFQNAVTIYFQVTLATTKQSRFIQPIPTRKEMFMAPLNMERYCVMMIDEIINKK